MAESRADRLIDWIEGYCRVPEGRLIGQPVRLRDWQRDILRGIYDGGNTRRAIITFGRKNGKTALSGCLLLAHLCGPEARPNSQLFSAAQSRDQAALLFHLAAKMVRMNPDLSEFVGVRDTAKQLYCAELGTLYRALSADASTAYGLSPVFIVHDELGQVRGPRSELFEALETATAAQESPLSIVISTQAATDDDMLSVLTDDAKSREDDRVKLFQFSADAALDPFSEEAIRQANPAYGDFQNADEVLAMAEDARRMPSRESEYRNLVLNQRVETHAPYIARAVWESCAGEPEPFDGPVYAGLDLSATTDLTALVLAGRSGDHVSVRPSFWLPGEGLAAKARADRVPYDVWHRDGNLSTCPGRTVSYEFVAEYLLDVFQEYDIRRVAFDRWNMRHLKPWLERVGFDDEMMSRFVDFGQGFKSMSPALRTLDDLLLNGKILHGGHPVLTMCAANAVVKADPAGNRKLVKTTATRRIDGMIALAMAVSVMSEADETTATPPTPWDADPEFSLVT